MKIRTFFCRKSLTATKLLPALLLMAVTAPLGAQEEGTIKEQRFNAVVTSVPSLQINPSARSGGMGDVGVSTTPDVFA